MARATAIKLSCAMSDFLSEGCAHYNALCAGTHVETRALALMRKLQTVTEKAAVAAEKHRSRAQRAPAPRASSRKRASRKNTAYEEFDTYTDEQCGPLSFLCRWHSAEH